MCFSTISKRAVRHWRTARLLMVLKHTLFYGFFWHIGIHRYTPAFPVLLNLATHNIVVHVLQLVSKRADLAVTNGATINANDRSNLGTRTNENDLIGTV